MMEGEIIRKLLVLSVILMDQYLITKQDVEYIPHKERESSVCCVLTWYFTKIANFEFNDSK